jgi:YesN/AraC family two-component response regulator
MYKVLLVDDEKWVLKGIEMTFKWEKYGFEVIASTTKSAEAWELINKLKPHVVFSDVRMANISGLKLVSMAREEKIDCEFVIISGYSEFEYAREALKNAVFDYCLKPIKEDEAENVLKALKTFLDGKFSKTDKNAHKPEAYRTDNKTFNSMLKYIHQNYNTKLQLGELANMFFMNANYCCFLFKKYFDKSFSQYVIQIRMDETARLIENDKSLSIDQIAQVVGYEDYYYFSKVFKKHFGVTPTQYKKNI